MTQPAFAPEPPPARGPDDKRNDRPKDHLIPASSLRPTVHGGKYAAWRRKDFTPPQGAPGTVNISGQPWNLGMMNQQPSLSLGADDCYTQMSERLALLPAVLSSSKTITGPMVPTLAEAQFGETIVFTNLDVQSQGLVSRLVQGGSVPTPYLLRGLCIVARIVPYRYGMLGAALNQGVVDGAHIPLVVSPGSVPEDNNVTSGALQASFDYNSAGVIAYDLFLRTYQFQYVLQGRYIFVNERAIDIGVVDSDTMPMGFGTGQYDPSQDINTANSATINPAGVGFQNTIGRIFAPPNCTEATADGIAVNPPMVQIQWIQPRAPGVYGCCYPIRPHILWPLQTYQMFFQRTGQTDLEHDRLLQEISTPSFAKPLDAWPVGLTVGANGPAVFLGVLPMRYFQLELGIMFRGGEFMPVDALEWLMRWGFPFAEMWLSQPYVLGTLADTARAYGLKGIPRPLPTNKAFALAQQFAGLAGLGDEGDDVNIDAIATLGEDPSADRLRRIIPNQQDRLKALQAASEAHYGAGNAWLKAA